jgi:leader peptidase (prepilin peptidase) / N-methyltransferase
LSLLHFFLQIYSILIMFLASFESAFGVPEIFGYIFFFVLGSIIGSFLNVVIHRVPHELSIVFPNSACPKCEKAIKPYDNIPIFSWLILGGKCRNCKNPISARYVGVEILTGLVFTLVFWHFGLTWFLPVALIFCAAIVSLIFIDAEHMILPDVITYPMLFSALIIRVAFPLIFGNAAYFLDVRFSPLSGLQLSVWLISLIGAIFGGLVGGGFLWLVGEIWKRLRGMDAMGLGDVKMMFGVGALLGWRLTLLTIFVAAFTGAVAGVGVMIKDREKGMQAQIPFGIFLGIGSIISLIFGEQMIGWYFDNFFPK